MNPINDCLHQAMFIASESYSGSSYDLAFPCPEDDMTEDFAAPISQASVSLAA